MRKGSKESLKRRVQGRPVQSSKARMRIEAAIRRIPDGKVSTYGAVARAAGLPGAARQVAKVLHRGFGLPWHRVLGAGGEIKLRGDSAIEQRLRLEWISAAEGDRVRVVINEMVQQLKALGPLCKNGAERARLMEVA